MKITKDTHKKLCEVYGETLIKIGSEEYTDDELDNILKVLLTFLMDMEGLDVEVVKENLKNTYIDEVSERLY